MICANFFLLIELSICGTVCLMIDVVHAEPTNTFKSKLDKFWSNREIIYYYGAEIQGTGSESVIY